MSKSNISAKKLPTQGSDSSYELSNKGKMSKIQYHFTQIMETLGLDLEDDSLKDTPKRVAKMYVEEIFKGLSEDNKPSISLFENKYNYNQMLVEKNIGLYSQCEHHFLPIIGKAHVAYIPGEKVIGLSKLNRIVDYYARRPQVQERLTMNIAEELMEVLGHKDVAVYIEADHLCVASRGIEDRDSATVTSFYSGRFEEEAIKQEFMRQAIG